MPNKKSANIYLRVLSESKDNKNSDVSTLNSLISEMIRQGTKPYKNVKVNNFKKSRAREHLLEKVARIGFRE